MIIGSVWWFVGFGLCEYSRIIIWGSLKGIYKVYTHVHTKDMFSSGDTYHVLLVVVYVMNSYQHK